VCACVCVREFVVCVYVCTCGPRLLPVFVCVAVSDSVLQCVAACCSTCGPRLLPVVVRE